MLTTCLALVKPVGMSQADTDAWLVTAAREVAYLPKDILENACSKARRTVTYHGQIVPAIIKEGEEQLISRRSIRRIQEARNKVPKERRIENSPWEPTQAELDELKARAAANLKA